MVLVNRTKAAVLHAPNDLRIEEIDIPRIGNHDILIRVKAFAICTGTDPHIVSGEFPGPGGGKFPCVPGHEDSGEIIAIGRDAKGFAIGDHVMARAPYRPYQRNEPLGGWAEYIVAPEEQTFRLPEGLSYEEGALITDGAIGPIDAIRCSNLRLGDTVVVIGQGPVGLSIAQMAKIAGAGRVVVTDIFDSKLDVAREIGAADVLINARKEDPLRKIIDITDGKGADIVIEAVGESGALNQAIEMSRMFGRVVVYGYHTKPLQLPYQPLFNRSLELVIKGRSTPDAYAQDFRIATGLISSKRLELKPLITQRYPLRDINIPLTFIRESSERIVKAIINP